MMLFSKALFRMGTRQLWKSKPLVIGVALTVALIGGGLAAYYYFASSTLPTTTTKLSDPAPTPQPATLTLDQIVASINQHLQPYGISATLAPPNNAETYSTWSTLDASDVDSLNKFSSYLVGQFGKYPTDLVVNSGLRTIGLVKDLVVSGGGRAAAPAPTLASMLYDVNAMNNGGDAYARKVVSHEYWHYLDYKMQGSYLYGDTQWDACNPAGFSYGSGGESAYAADSGYEAVFHPSAGFITAYSKYSIAEDRAEMFGWLIDSPSSVKSLNDGGINCKINRLTVIARQLSPAMGF